MRVSRLGADGVLDSLGVREALPRYVDVVRKRAYPMFMISNSYESSY